MNPQTDYKYREPASVLLSIGTLWDARDVLSNRIRNLDTEIKKENKILGPHRRKNPNLQRNLEGLRESLLELNAVIETLENLRRAETVSAKTDA